MHYTKARSLRFKLGVYKSGLMKLNSGNSATFWLAQYLTTINNDSKIDMEELIAFSTHARGTVLQHLRDLHSMGLLNVRGTFVYVKDDEQIEIENGDTK